MYTVLLTFKTIKNTSFLKIVWGYFNTILNELFGSCAKLCYSAKMPFACKYL